MFLAANGPFGLAHTLESGQAFRWRHRNDSFRGIVAGLVFTVRQATGGVEFESEPRPAVETAPVLRSYLRLDDDLAALYARLGKDRRLAEAIAACPGLRLVRQDPWECLVSFVISAYSNIPRITGHIEDICKRYGEPIACSDGPAYGFPSPARLAEAGEAGLRAMGLGYRAKYLCRLPRLVLNEGPDLLSLRAAPYRAAREALLALPGVGEKVADCVLAFSLDQGRAFPVDVWVRRAVQESYYRGRRVTDRRVRLWAARRFGDDAAYAQQYLFHYRRLLHRASGQSQGA